MEQKTLCVALMAEDDPDERFFAKEAFGALGLDDVRFVEDGEELLDYLNRRGNFADPELAPQPAFVLLDLNMPKKDGREALAEIKADPNLKEMPIIIFTTSDKEEDKNICRKAGANDYIVKPANHEKLIKTIDQIVKRWHGEIPSRTFPSASVPQPLSSEERSREMDRSSQYGLPVSDEALTHAHLPRGKRFKKNHHKKVRLRKAMKKRVGRFP